MFKNITPNLMVKNVNRSIKFYTEILGFDFVLGVPENTLEMIYKFNNDTAMTNAYVRKDSVGFMFHENLTDDISEFKDKEIIATFTMYVDIENFDEYYNNVKDKTTLYKDIEVKWYGMKEFYVKDPDGYILVFAQKV